MLDNSRRHQFIGQKTARAEQTQKNRKQKNYRKKVLWIEIKSACVRLQIKIRTIRRYRYRYICRRR